jgi:hypothetical protein
MCVLLFLAKIEPDFNTAPKISAGGTNLTIDFTFKTKKAALSGSPHLLIL